MCDIRTFQKMMVFEEAIVAVLPRVVVLPHFPPSKRYQTQGVIKLKYKYTDITFIDLNAHGTNSFNLASKTSGVFFF